MRALLDTHALLWFDLAKCLPARPVAGRADPAYVALSEDPMETLQLEATIGPDGVLRIAAPTHQRPGPANVVVVISPVTELPKTFRWRDLAGLGKEVWEGEDAQAYVNRLRDE